MARVLRSQSEQRAQQQYGNDPFCQLARRKQFDLELETIRAQSRSIWSKPDTSLTTHGHYFVDSYLKLICILVFVISCSASMRTEMREIPNTYGVPPARPPSREYNFLLDRLGEQSAQVP